MEKIPSRYPALAQFVQARAIREGDFTLASGAKSSVYCDGKQVTFSGEGALLVADAILNEIDAMPVDAIGGLEMGAIPIVAAVALRSAQRGKNISAFVVRKEVKGHGTRKVIEGPVDAPCNVVIVDDVVTKGGSIIQAITAAKAAGHTVLLALSILDREEGGAKALLNAGIPYRSLVTMSEVRDGNARQLEVAGRGHA